MLYNKDNITILLEELEKKYLQLQKLWISSDVFKKESSDVSKRETRLKPPISTFSIIIAVIRKLKKDITRPENNSLNSYFDSIANLTSRFENLITGYYEFQEEIDIASSSTSIPQISSRKIGFGKILLIIDALFQEYLGEYSKDWQGCVISLGKSDFEVHPEFQILSVPSYLIAIKSFYISKLTIIAHEAAHYILQKIPYIEVPKFNNDANGNNNIKENENEDRFARILLKIDYHRKCLEEFVKDAFIVTKIPVENYARIIEEIQTDIIAGLLAGPKYYVDLYDFSSCKYLMEESNINKLLETKTFVISLLDQISKNNTNPSKVKKLNSQLFKDIEQIIDYLEKVSYKLEISRSEGQHTIKNHIARLKNNLTEYSEQINNRGTTNLKETISNLKRSINDVVHEIKEVVELENKYFYIKRQHLSNYARLILGKKVFEILLQENCWTDNKLFSIIDEKLRSIQDVDATDSQDESDSIFFVLFETLHFKHLVLSWYYILNRKKAFYITEEGKAEKAAKQLKHIFGDPNNSLEDLLLTILNYGVS